MNVTLGCDWRCGVWALVFAFGLVISGCGGGGGTSVETAAPPPPGTLDSTFGTGGTVITPIGKSASASGVVLQPDGKIVVAGSMGDDSLQSTFALVRYNADGSLDLGFGSEGKVTVPSLSVTYAFAQGVALQPDGKIIMAGHNGGSSFAVDANCVLVRFNTDGSLDASFGAGGVVLSKPAHGDASTCAGPAILPGGKIAVAVGEVSSVFGGYGAIGAMQFNADGTRDSAFGVGGEAIAPVSLCCGSAASIAVRPDGKIIVGGGAHGVLVFGLPPSAYVLARFTAAGTIDPAFGSNGVVSWDSPDSFPFPEVGALVLQPDSKIVAIGGHVWRFLADGTIDSGFGTAVTASIPGTGGALQWNGKIVVAGREGDGTAPSTGFALWRLGPDGVPDPGFGTGGSVVTPIGTGIASGGAVAIQPDGRIVVAGASSPALVPNGPYINFAVARYFGDPSAAALP